MMMLKERNLDSSTIALACVEKMTLGPGEAYKRLGRAAAGLQFCDTFFYDQPFPSNERLLEI
jgi:hypothetical protein